MLRFVVAQKLNLRSDDVQSAKYYVKVLGEQQALHMYAVNDDWCSITGNWSNNYEVGEYVSTSSYGEGYISFNITEIMKRRCDDEGRLEHNGVQIQVKDENENRLLLLSNDSVLYIPRTVIQINKNDGI